MVEYWISTRLSFFQAIAFEAEIQLFSTHQARREFHCNYNVAHFKLNWMVSGWKKLCVSPTSLVLFAGRIFFFERERSSVMVKMDLRVGRVVCV